MSRFSSHEVESGSVFFDFFRRRLGQRIFQLDDEQKAGLGEDYAQKVETLGSGAGAALVASREGKNGKLGCFETEQGAINAAKDGETIPAGLACKKGR